MTKQQLIEDNLNLVYHLIHRYYPTFAGDEDIVQSGMLGLCNAADRWDAEKSKFSTFASKCILNEINMEFRRRKKHKGTLSLDYEVTDSDGDTVPFGDFVVGDEDVVYVDLDSWYPELLPIEQDVFDLWRRGLTTEEISNQLNRSKQIVSRAIRKIKTKWKIANGVY